MCKYTHICAYAYTRVNIHMYMYTHICMYAYTYTHSEIFPFRFMEEKSITYGQLCKTLMKLFFQEPKNHISKHATNCKMVTTSGGAHDTVFGHILIHTCPQIDHKTPAGWELVLCTFHSYVSDSAVKISVWTLVGTPT